MLTERICAHTAGMAFTRREQRDLLGRLSTSACEIPYASAKPIVVGSGLTIAAAMAFTVRGLFRGSATAIPTTQDNRNDDRNIDGKDNLMTSTRMRASHE